MKNLYRRYRPLNLSDVIGQEQVTKPLTSALKAGKISHAYLFIGPRGCGKTSVARIMAHEINGFKYELEDEYVDIIEIDGASNRGIDDIRELREKATIAPTSGKYKVYIIDEVHMLTPQAFNALLKTLEEPPAHVIFIMATTDAHKVPVTITSRSQIFTFKLADPEVMQDFLKKVAKHEKIDIDDDALRIIVKRGGGSFRDSLSLLDQLSTLSTKTITKDAVTEALGLPEEDSLQRLLNEYVQGDVVKITTQMKELLSLGNKPETIAESIISFIVDNPQPEYLTLLSRLPDVRPPFADAKLLVALTAESLTQASGQMHPASITAQNSLPHKAPSPHVSLSKAPSTSPSGTSTTKNNTDNISEAPDEPSSQDASTSSDIFDWHAFAEQTNEVIKKQLEKCEHEFKNNTLHLYPRTKMIKTILESKNNKQVLSNAAAGKKINIHEAGEHPASITDSATKDPTISKISAIMGGEVINDGGNSPF